MTLRDIVYVLVLLGCGFAVGYQTGVDRTRTDGSAEGVADAPHAVGRVDGVVAAPTASSPAGEAAPTVATETVGAADTGDTTAPSSPQPDTDRADAGPTDAGAQLAPDSWVTPPELLAGDANNLPAAVKSRLPNMSSSLKGIPILGDVFTAKVLITIFGDLQCRYTAEGLAALEAAMAANPGLLAIGFRHFPMTHHQWARGGSLAAWAAGEQGKFWEYIRKVMAAQNDQSEAALRRIAEELGLDLARFDRDRASPSADWQLQADAVVGRSIDADATPTLLVNGRRFLGLPDPDVFSMLLDQSRREVEELMAKGEPLLQARGKACERAELRMPLRNFKESGLDLLLRVPMDSAPRRGAKDPLVGIVVFSDFQCPPCSRTAQLLTELVAEDPEVALSFRQFPMQIHDHARDAALASLFAHDFGKFWELHDEMMASQSQLDRASLEAAAAKIGLDPALLRRAFTNEALAMQLRQDMLLGSLVGVSGTPSVFVNGRLLAGVPKRDALLQAIKDAKALSVDVMKAYQLPREGYYDALMNLIKPN